MEFRILGPLDVTSEGRPIVLPGSRERTVLALLLLSANRVASSERLIDELWDDRPPERGADALRVFASYTGEFRTNAVAHQISAGLRLTW